MKAKVALSVVLTALLLNVALALADDAAQPIYQLTVRLIEADASVVPGTFQVPSTDATTTEEDFMKSLSEQNPGPTFTLVRSIWVTALPDYSISFGTEDENGAASATVELRPFEGKVLIQLECAMKTSSGNLACKTTISAEEGKGYLVGGSNTVTASSSSTVTASRLIILHLLPATPNIEEGTE